MKRQWRGFVSGVLVTLTLVGVIGTAMAASFQKQATLNYSNIKIILNGKAVTPTDASGNAVEPFTIDGTAYLPVRGIANALNMDVAWDGATQTVTLTEKGSAGQPAATPNESASGETIGQKNALKSANNYLSFQAFSRDGLIKQLEFEKYSHEDAVYAADNCGADWNEQAVKSASNYLKFSAFSRDSLIAQLEFEGFTNEQAVYGAEANGY